MVSKEGDPDEFGRLGRAFEGISCNFENWLLMLKSYLEIPNMWSIPTFILGLTSSSSASYQPTMPPAKHL
jgi:hypothetical protein